MVQRRGFRWLLFTIAVIDFFLAVLWRADAWTIGIFFASGGGWYWLERRKMRELDAPNLFDR
ncbi:MAG: hypothetical protein HY078_10770 [Elusimicrobia bacterium]|nr:hypothetical protein [Elusimicrobiota bacterium]